MNETATNIAEMEFEDVRGENGGGLRIINASKLGDIRGVVAIGRFARTVPNKYKPTKPSFVLEGIQAIDAETGELSDATGLDILLDQAGNLGVQMKEVEIGELIKVEYKGKTKMTSGQYKGTEAHNFKVLRAKRTADDDSAA